MIPKKISTKKLEKIIYATGVFILFVFLLLCFQIYVPANIFSNTTVTYTIQKGSSDSQIGGDLQKLGVIRSNSFFQFYILISFQKASLQAGKYNFSPRMSIYDIVKKMSRGDVVKNNITILAGWDSSDIANYLDQKNVCKKNEFLSLIKNDYSAEYDFLADKPKDTDIEGYLFPDTYEVADGDIVLVLRKRHLSTEV